MAAKQFLEFLLKLLNFFLTLSGLFMVVYGVYRLMRWKQASIKTHSKKMELVLARRLLLSVHQASHLFDKLPSAWFLYLFMAVGAILFIISCCGCVGTAARSSCCLSFVSSIFLISNLVTEFHSLLFYLFSVWSSFVTNSFKMHQYSAFMVIIVLAELGFAAFMFFDHNWKEEIPTDKTGKFYTVYNFFHSSWKITKWIALGIVLLEIMAILLALFLQAANRTIYDSSDDELIVPPHFRRALIAYKHPMILGTPSTIDGERT